MPESRFWIQGDIVEIMVCPTIYLLACEKHLTLICKLGFLLYAAKSISNCYPEPYLTSIRYGILYYQCGKIPYTELSSFESLHDTSGNSVNPQD